MVMAVLPDDVIVEILSWLPVKFLLRFRSVSKSWKYLIDDPSFVNLHLQRSPKHTNLLLTLDKRSSIPTTIHDFVLPCSIPSLLLRDNHHDHASSYSFPLPPNSSVIDSCNGLVCLTFSSYDQKEFADYHFLLWNPATRLVSKTLPPSLHLSYEPYHSFARFGFGYDHSTHTYKLAALFEVNGNGDARYQTIVQLHNMGGHNHNHNDNDNCWRKVLSLPSTFFPPTGQVDVGGRFLNNSINWLGYVDGRYHQIATLNQLVILSLDLRTETCTRLLLPHGLGQLSALETAVMGITVLRDSLCFFYDYMLTEFILWQMKDFGVEKSWIQLLKIQSHGIVFLPLCTSENGDDVVMLTSHSHNHVEASHNHVEAILYSRRDNAVIQRTQILNCSKARDSKVYVQSLTQL